MDTSTIDARDIFNVAHWGEGYFDVNDAGHVVVAPRRNPAAGAVDLYELAQSLEQAGLALPVLVRFVDILRDRVANLAATFAGAIANHEYSGRYRPVFPIKVNQQASVVREILRDGVAGLECGSKPELMAVLGVARPGGTVICNGYKDREYLRLALIGQALGLNIFIVIEKLSELDLLLAEAAAMQIKPRIGLRVRLATLGAGKWQNTGGEKSKFGLSASQVLTALDKLRAADRIDCLQLLHCHLGSQVANIRDIQRGMTEVARFYAELRLGGAPIQVVDVGGGLGVDYEGTRSRSFCSMNYSVERYAEVIVRTLAEMAAENDLPQPDIVSESGRALTAHHAVLITDVIDTEAVSERAPAAPAADAPTILHDLWASYASAERNGSESYQDALYWLDEVHNLYSHGVLDLAERAQAEEIYQALCRKLRNTLRGGRNQRTLMDELNQKLADKVFCNLSIFQSLPDVWAIEQIFPIMPIHRLDEPLARRAVLKDLTCDSDGRIDRYVDRDGVEPTLPLHAPNGEPYLIGFFLVGAYQEILGDMHNLFGDTNAVNVELDGKGGWRLARPEHGDTAAELLRYVHFDTDELLATYRRRIEAAGLPAAQAGEYLDALAAGLDGYTYLEK
ncbi:MAG TPA: biosynthetic arginine decarboxylase [Gammaproteobacteria bacterium]|nr:biosynthetic arginine decarboxylase [Gammaproteobacteria bacterium]